MFENVYKENLFIMKLLTTQPEFLEDIQEIRKKLKIPTDGFTNERDKNKWLGKNLSKLDSSSKSLQDKNSTFFNAENLIKKYQLRYNFLCHIEHYIFYSEVDAPKINFDVSIGPDHKVLRSEKWVSIKAYAPLTKEEIRQATKKLLKLQSEFLPPKVTLDLRPKIDIDLAIKIEREMKKRKKEYKENPHSYLAKVRKQYGEEEYERTRRVSGYKEEKILDQYTSREIAEIFFNQSSKATLVRKIYSTIQQKRKQLFG